MTIDAPDARARILIEARRLFVEFGFNGISMREIAAATGISKPGLYYHFKDKEDLLLAILTDSLEQIARVVGSCCDPSQTARQRLSQVLRDIFEWAPEQRSMIRLASQEMAHLSPKARQDFSVMYEHKFIGGLAEILQAGMRSGELRQVNPHLATWVLLGMMYPFFYTSSSNRVQDDASAVLDEMLSIYFDGLGRQNG